MESELHDFDPELIRANLQTVLSTTEFSNSPRLRKFLAYVVECSLDGKAESLKAYNIAVDALGKDPDFDPNDPYVRNIARDVRRSLAIVYGANNPDIELEIDIPKGSYKPIFKKIEDPNLKDAESVYHGSARVRTSTSIREPGSSPTETHINSIHKKTAFKQLFLQPTVAVIPFKQQINAEEGDAIGEVIADNLITRLSRSSHLEIISRLSTTQFKHNATDLETIREKLNPNYVLSGRYLVVNKTIRLNVEVSDVASMHVLWADCLTTPIADVLTGKDELDETLSSKLTSIILQHELNFSRVSPLDSLELHTLLISAIELIHRPSADDFIQARQMLEILRRKCPRHSLPHAYMAHWHIMSVNRELGWSTNLENEKNSAIKSCEKALELDPYDSLAHTIRGVAATNFEKDPDAGKKYYDQAIKLNPNNSLAHAFRAVLHGFMEEGKLAMNDANTSIRLSPLDPQLYFYELGIAVAAMADNEYELAEKHALQSYTLNANHTSTIRALIAIEVELGKITEASKYAKTLMALDPDFNTNSYRANAANSIFKVGEKIADALETAGVPKS